MPTITPLKRPHYDIMLSSTFKDLEGHRAAVIDAIQRLQLFAQAMEGDSALPEGLIEASLNKVKVSDAYVGIVGYRYGQIPESAQENPKKLSITELEYEEAERRKLPICMFIMSDKHPVPRGALGSSTAEEEKKLEAFRKRVMGKHISAEFDSIDDLKTKALQSLGVLRERLDGLRGAVTPQREERAPLSLLPLVAIPPFTPGHEFTGRAKELQGLDDWAVSPKEPVLVLEAIGGMGKSMLSWHWVNQRAREVRPDFAGVFWYSFYERGADMKDFCAYCVAYMRRQPVEQFRERKTASLGDELVQLLRERAWLIVLDGLERVLVAYNRYDAAQVRDEEVSGDSTNRKARECIRPADANLLRTLSEAGPSKCLISSRLMPAALLNSSGLERPGVAHVQLIGLDPSDAEAMLRRVGIKGDSAQMRRYVDKNFGCHPLVVGVVGGLIRNYAPAPDDFARWMNDPNGGGSIDLATMDLVQRRNHILKAAFDDLDPEVRTLLTRIALVSEAIDYQTVAALNPRLPEAPEKVEQSRGWKQNAAEQWLGDALRDLESRGLLQWDRANSKYDLHPVVRGYAVSSLAPERRDGVAQRVIDHFASRPDPPGEKATTMNDVRNGLEVARILIRLGRFQEAVAATWNFADALFWNLEAYEEYLALVRPLFPNGWLQRPPNIDPVVLSGLWAWVGGGLGSLGMDSEARRIHEEVIQIDIELDRERSIWSGLFNISYYSGVADRVRLVELIGTLTTFLGDAECSTIFCLHQMQFSMQIGDISQAERWWKEFDAMPRPTTRQVYRPGEAEFALARLHFLSQTLEEALLTNAEDIARRGNSRPAIRELRGLRGEWMLSLGRYAEAVTAFEEFISLSREVNLDTSASEARLALAEAKQGERDRARETADRLSASERPPDLELAELYLALGDTAAARKHALPAYERAWGDGLPYVWWWHLQRARAVLADIGEPEPQLSPFDASKSKPFPFEAKLLAYLEEKRKEKEDVSEAK